MTSWARYPAPAIVHRGKCSRASTCGPLASVVSSPPSSVTTPHGVARNRESRTPVTYGCPSPWLFKHAPSSPLFLVVTWNVCAPGGNNIAARAGKVCNESAINDHALRHRLGLGALLGIFTTASRVRWWRRVVRRVISVPTIPRHRPTLPRTHPTTTPRSSTAINTVRTSSCHSPLCQLRVELCRVGIGALAHWNRVSPARPHHNGWWRRSLVAA